MEQVRTLIVGAGVTGLAAAAFSHDPDYLILEADSEIGGYCKTVRREGFVWDYSGHFFHFRHADLENWLRARMPGQEVRTITRRALVAYGGSLIDFPFQKNIHQLPREEFIDCLHDLFFARASQDRLAGATSAVQPESFAEMLHGRYGRSIAEKFLVPYNEKLYACDLGTLDPEAMGRFFPHADLADVIRNMKSSDRTGYNATFTYPEGGAIQYIQALASTLPPQAIAVEEPLRAVDLDRKVAVTSRREIRYQRLISSAPLPRFVALCGLAHDPAVFTWNKVLVFNLGFDRKGPRGVHWIYYPDRDRVFYRIGFYDNIFETDRMSLYVEVGFARDAPVDVGATRRRVLEDLAREGLTGDHQLVAEHSVVMDPAYVHITRKSIAERERLAALLQSRDVYSIGRYGGWTYCSIEDNIVEARALMNQLG
jgi:protoporphyrinogen oxidase